MNTDRTHANETDVSAVDVELVTLKHEASEFGPITLRVAATGPEDGPLIVCVHGWPETWHSWRFQMEHFAAQGFRVAAMNVRGYPGSSTPTEIAAYRLSELAGDVAAVVAELGGPYCSATIGALQSCGRPPACTRSEFEPWRVSAFRIARQPRATPWNFGRLSTPTASST